MTLLWSIHQMCDLAEQHELGYTLQYRTVKTYECAVQHTVQLSWAAIHQIFDFAKQRALLWTVFALGCLNSVLWTVFFFDP